MPTCPGCSREVEEGVNFCPACGESITEQSAAVAAMVRDAQKALSDNPADTAARYNLAIAYKLGGKDELALQEFGRVSEQLPDFADVFYEIGLLLAKKGRLNEAREALKKARELNPEDDRAAKVLERLNG